MTAILFVSCRVIFSMMLREGASFTLYSIYFSNLFDEAARKTHVGILEVLPISISHREVPLCLWKQARLDSELFLILFSWDRITSTVRCWYQLTFIFQRRVTQWVFSLAFFRDSCCSVAPALRPSLFVIRYSNNTHWRHFPSCESAAWKRNSTLTALIDHISRRRSIGLSFLAQCDEFCPPFPVLLLGISELVINAQSSHSWNGALFRVVPFFGSSVRPLPCSVYLHSEKRRARTPSKTASVISAVQAVPVLKVNCHGGQAK